MDNTERIAALKDALLAEWDFCAEGKSDALAEARRNGMSEGDIFTATAQATNEWNQARIDMQVGGL